MQKREQLVESYRTQRATYNASIEKWRHQVSGTSTSSSTTTTSSEASGPAAAAQASAKQQREASKVEYESNLQSLQAQLVGSPPGSASHKQIVEQIRQLRLSYRQTIKSDHSAAASARRTAASGGVWPFTLTGTAPPSSSTSSEFSSDTSVGAEVVALRKSHQQTELQVHQQWVTLTQQIQQTPAGPQRTALLKQRSALVASYKQEEIGFNTTLEGLRAQTADKANNANAGGAAAHHHHHKAGTAQSSSTSSSTEESGSATTSTEISSSSSGTSSSSSSTAGGARTGGGGYGGFLKKQHGVKQEMNWNQQWFRGNLTALQGQLATEAPGSSAYQQTQEQIVTLRTQHKQIMDGLNQTLGALSAKAPPSSWVLSMAQGSSSTSTTSSTDAPTSTEIGGELHSIKQENATLNYKTHAAYVNLQVC